MNTTKIKVCDYEDYTMLDGYAWAVQQENSIHGKLHVDPSIGEWPYYVVARGARNDKYIIKEFVEHDVKTWIYEDRAEYTQHLKTLREFTAENL
jgi:hypothetical protein